MNRLTTSLILLFPAFFLLNSCNLLRGDDEPSILWEDEDLDEYVLYAFTPFIDFLTVIDIQSGDILKTVEDLDGIQSVVTNSDGTQLFVSTGTQPSGADPGQIIRIDTQTWEREVIFDHAAELLTSKDGRIYFITKHNDPETGPVIPERFFGSIDPLTGNIESLATINVAWRSIFDYRNIEVCSMNNSLYAIDSMHSLYKYDFDDNKLLQLFEEEINFSQLNFTMSEDCSTVFIPGGPILDLEQEEIIGGIPVWRLGSAAVRQDMKEVYITDPGGYLREPFPSGEISIYSPEKDKIIDNIQIEVDDPFYNPGTQFLTDMIFLTESERYAIVSNWGRTYFVIDLRIREVIHFATYTPDEMPNLITQKIFLSKKPKGL